jgi:hypothetical protein
VTFYNILLYCDSIHVSLSPFSLSLLSLSLFLFFFFFDTLSDRYQHVMYVFGGTTTGLDFLSDMYMLDLDHFVWSVYTANDTGVGRAMHSALMTLQGRERGRKRGERGRKREKERGREREREKEGERRERGYSFLFFLSFSLFSPSFPFLSLIPNRCDDRVRWCGPLRRRVL